MSDWRTMDTAPKDGTLIDVWAGGRRVVDVRWEPEDYAKGRCWAEAFPTARGMAGSDGFPAYLYPQPTHWMPTPPEAPRTVNPAGRRVRHWFKPLKVYHVTHALGCARLEGFGCSCGAEQQAGERR